MSQVEIFMRCLSLASKDMLSNSDPFVVVYSREVMAAHSKTFPPWTEIHRTKTMKNNPNPQFTASVKLLYTFEKEQPLKFMVYDRDDESEDLTKHGLIGFTETSLGRLVGAKAMVSNLALIDIKDRIGKAGRIVLSVQKIAGGNEVLDFQFRASSLEKKNLLGLGSSDPFFTISLMQGDGRFQPVFQSEYVSSTSKPTWKRRQVPVQQICNGNLERDFRIDIYDHEKSGKHHFIGCFISNLKEMQTKKTFNVVNAKAKLQKSSSGEFKVEVLNIVERHSFLEYLEGGLELKMVIGVDFSVENKIKGISSSEYEKALSSIGKILENYDSDKSFPMYGFGAAVSGFDHSVFPMSLDSKQASVHGVEGMLEAFKKCERAIASDANSQVEARLSPLLEKVIKESSVPTKQQSYTVLVVIMQGKISDFKETVAKVVEASKHGLSIILVGTGGEEQDFTQLEKLDGEEGEETEVSLATKGEFAVRDIVQFVPLRDFLDLSSEELSSEILKELPGQVEKYFQLYQIKPNPKIVEDNFNL